MIIMGSILKETGGYDEASIDAALAKVVSARHADLLQYNKKALSIGAEY